jgi:competence protein ComEA
MESEGTEAPESVGDGPPAPAGPAADAPRAARRSRAEAPAVVNVNTADAALLERLPGVGPALAARILAYRREHGPFRRVEDVEQVRGIGPRTLARMRPYLRL